MFSNDFMKSWVFGSFQLLLLAVVLLGGLAEVSNSLAPVCSAAWRSPKGLLDAPRELLDAPRELFTPGVG